MDANICIPLINRAEPSIQERLRACIPAQVSLCSVVKAELLFGAHKSSRVDENLRLIQAFCAPLASLDFDDASAHEYGILRAHLERQGRLIGPNDLMIASIALAHRHVLVTRNLAEFRRVPGLRVESW